ncbi:MAG: FtsX-like permease family protein [Clostridium sp.]|jgi:putative ABC transport system permease protein|nr:FtsX-like permease family protein [Clostridium sp.]
MYRKIIKNDIAKSKLISITITAFILIAALLTSLAAILCVNLFSAIDNMVERAKTPHFMQMHAGDVDMRRLESFANENGVQDFQVAKFLNIDGAEIVIGKNSLADSVQDNGLSTQNSRFDFLLDLNGEIVYPADGEIYVPIYYRKEWNVKTGEQVVIKDRMFTVAGFIRDSQMNAALISSKRFLVSENDLDALMASGNLENLIEFRLPDAADISDFETAYINAGLEANGPPPITQSLFKLANAISDGMMIAVLILISVLVILVTFLCVRFTLLAKVEEDYKEIGVLKAIGIRISGIQKIYLSKYGLMASVACVLGFFLSLVVQQPLMGNIRLYMGESNSPVLSVLLGLFGAALIFAVVLLYVNRVLKMFRRISAVEAMRFGAPQEKSKGAKRFLLSKNRLFPTNIFLGIKDVLSRKKLYATMLTVLIISTFMMIVPQNIYSTMASKNFMTYMGIGKCDMRFDIQQTDHIPEKSAEMMAALQSDGNVSEYVLLTSYMFDVKANDGSTEHLKVELGDPLVFPIEYASGAAPASDTEIALSHMVADDYEKKVGDTLVLVMDGRETSLTVSGIYSDITNGGKTAKAVFDTEQTNVLWSIIAVKLYDTQGLDEMVGRYRQQFRYAKVANIDEYIGQTFSSTIWAIESASYAAIAVTVLLAILVTLLFIKMLVTKDRYSTAVLKAEGFTSKDIRRQYMTRSVLILMIGVITGTVLANTLGELAGVALISSFGASTFRFEINPLFAYLAAPLILAAAVMIATRFGVSEIRKIEISQHIKE